MSLDEVISTYVDDGDLIGLGGLSFWRKPLSACREMINQGKKDLTIFTFVGGMDVDMLVAAGSASRIRSSFVGMEVFGMAQHYREAAEKDMIEIIEETEASSALGLRASYLKVPFMPLKGIIGTDFTKIRKDIKQFKDPLGSGAELMAVPRIDLDVAIIHTNYSDEYGNANIQGAVWLDDDIAKTARKTIVITEKLVETEDIVHLSRNAQIPDQSVQAVVRVPFGAHPTSCFPLYTFDPLHIQQYMKMDFEEYKKRFITNKINAQYLNEVGGAQAILRILL
ncbi:MAG: Glutaconate CoA-transferase subunit A [Promethearchaeota archaeon]|nr:MAG: Glutaconate CoA-transferase subunit A [Candidatus Lokiarchaeota archaeon]